MVKYERGGLPDRYHASTQTYHNGGEEIGEEIYEKNWISPKTFVGYVLGGASASIAIPLIYRKLTGKLSDPVIIATLVILSTIIIGIEEIRKRRHKK